jgi:hypothetical protein
MRTKKRCNKLVLLSFVISINSVLISAQEIKTLTKEQYQKYFPSEIDNIFYYPSDEIVYILPSNEKNRKLQIKANIFYQDNIIKRFAKPGLRFRIITDHQALKEDLSNVNIWAFGTTKGNVWISKFLEKAKDFPIQISDTCIKADTSYFGNNQILTAIWYNPDNYIQSVVLYIPQNVKYIETPHISTNCRYSIYQNMKRINKNKFYWWNENKWTFYFKDYIKFERLRKNEMDECFLKIDNGLMRFPNSEILNNIKLTENIVCIDTIKILKESEKLSYFSDMEWLKGICKQNKVIALGENHYFKYSYYLMNKILFALNTFDNYTLLICELPYSWAGYINYYLNIRDDEVAFSFRDSVLKNMQIPSYDEIRDWNKMHPERKIEIGGSDIEHYLFNALDYTLIPYLKKVEPNANLEYSTTDTLKSFFERAQKIILQAKIQKTVGEFSFQTPQYMESVFENLKSSAPIKLNKRKWQDHTDRYKVMIRNLTEKQFLGEKISKQKSMFYGGANHFLINTLVVSNKSNQTDGYYLAHYFKPTKNKVYTIDLNTIGYSIEDTIQHIDPSLGFELEQSLINLYKIGQLKLNEPVVESCSEINNFIYKLSFKYPGYAFRINNINYENLKKVEFKDNFDRYWLITLLSALQDYNTTIIVPFSPIGEK